MKTLLLLLSLNACAYGIQDQPEQYGLIKARDNDQDSGSSNWGSGENSNGLPFGCEYDNVQDNGQIITSFVICSDNPGMAFKYLVDPPIDGKKVSK